MENDYIMQHLARCDLSFLSYVRPEILELKKQIEAAELRDRTPQDWSDEIEELEKYFDSIELPNGPIYLNDCTTISDISIFIDSHLAIVKSNNGREKFKPYLKRLRELKRIQDISI